MALNTTIKGRRISLSKKCKGRALTSNLLSIRCASIMRVYLLGCRILIERNEAVKQIIASVVIVVAAGVVWEVVTKRRMWEFLSEQVDFVQEQNLWWE
jgi:hypothetical protein